MGSLAAALIVLLAGPARADIASFSAGAIPPKGTLYSDDGYHYAYLASDGRTEAWLVDGRARARGEAGTLSAPAALSGNGGVLFHFVAVPGGWSPAINGRRVSKAVYLEIDQVQLSASGRNAAFAAKVPEGWVVVSAQGMGPAFPKPPLLLRVSDASTAYVVVWSGAQWLYRDHKPVQSLRYDSTSFSDDLRHYGGSWKDASNNFFVEVDGARTGPWKAGSAPVFSPDGKHSAYLAGEPPAWYGESNVVVLDGKKYPAKECYGCALILGDGGRAFQDKTIIVVDEKAQIHEYFLNGKSLGRSPSFGASSGGHFGLTVLGAGRGGNAFVLDGRPAESGAPMALSVHALVFDGESEYHYWSLGGKTLHLVCGTTQGGAANETRCAANAERLGWAPAKDGEPPSEPVSAQ